MIKILQKMHGHHKTFKVNLKFIELCKQFRKQLFSKKIIFLSHLSRETLNTFKDTIFKTTHKFD